MENNRYRPLRYFVLVFALTWTFWITAAVVGRSQQADQGLVTVLLLLGLLVPPAVALVMVWTSKSQAMKTDLRQKLFSPSRVKPLAVLVATVGFVVIVTISILISTIFGQSIEQLRFVEEYSFSLGGVSALLTIILAAFFEELGWRGYAQDALANFSSWFKASIIFGLAWTLWHLPLVFIPDTYQSGLLQQSPWFVVNFFAGILPMAILFTWVYLKNNRSIIACMVFHFFVNLCQEGIAMTQVTKCLETVVIYLAAIIVVLLSKDLFFSSKHIGQMPD